MPYPKLRKVNSQLTLLGSYKSDIS